MSRQPQSISGKGGPRVQRRAKTMCGRAVRLPASLPPSTALRQFDEQTPLARQTSDRLRDRLSVLQSIRSDARHRLSSWQAHEAATVARRRWTAGSGTEHHANVVARIESLSERLELAQAEAIAMEQLHAGVMSQAIDEYAQCEQAEAIETELARLKQR